MVKTKSKKILIVGAFHHPLNCDGSRPSIVFPFNG